MKKKLLAVLLTGAMVASFAVAQLLLFLPEGDDDNTLNCMGMGPELQYQIHADRR